MVRTILVTGGNKGIGYGTCLTLLRDYPDVSVLLGSRDAARGQAAVEKLQTEVPSAAGRLTLLLLDTNSTESVAEAASTVEAGSLYGVVNNAAVGFGHSLQSVLDTNYWGVRRVTETFLPKLQSSHGRLVNVSSAAGVNFVAGLSKDDPLRRLFVEPWSITGVDQLDEVAKTYKAKDEGPKSIESYGFSKALVSGYTYWLSRQYPNLVINAVTPGFINTDLTAPFGGATKTPLEGAVPIVYCLMEEDVVSRPQGLYYGSDCKRSPWHEYRDPGAPEYDGPHGPS